MNTGLLNFEGLIRPRDWIAGGISGIQYTVLNDSGDWSKYITAHENQRNQYFDTMGCVTWSSGNSLEAIMNLRIAKGLLGGKYSHMENLQWLQDNHYLDEHGKVKFSNRWITIQSGTTENGNYLVVVGDAWRKIGAVPYSVLPDNLDQYTSREEWFSLEHSEVERCQKIGQEFLQRFEVAYEVIYTVNPFGQSAPYPTEEIAYHLKHAPLQIAIPWCPSMSSGHATPCGKESSEHAVLLTSESNARHIEDHYPPYVKSLTTDYPVPMVLKLVINPKLATPMNEDAKKALEMAERKLVLAVPSGRNAYVKHGVALEIASERAGLAALAYIRENAENLSTGLGVKDELYDQWPKKPF